MAEQSKAENGKSAAGVIVAVGASAARTAVLERFLTRTSLVPDAAVVVVLQHREALDEASLRHSLAAAGLELTATEQGAVVEAGRIYLPPLNAIATLEQGRFRVRMAEQAPGERGTIDSFLVSLAQEEDGRSIAVMFAGTGADGTLGVTAIKHAGGLVVAEENGEHGSESLATSHSPAALADFIFPADVLPERVAMHVQRFVQQQETMIVDEQNAGLAAARTAIATILRNKTGHDFHGYKRPTFLRRVQRRMHVVQAEDIQAYLDVLRNQPDEAQQLFNDLLIGVTQFFRDPKEFELLEARVIPKLLEGKTRQDQVRMWVIGCSTGEEAYSLAILLRERLSELNEVPQVQIFATDLDGRALASARAGRYSDEIAKHMSPDRLARWFVKEGDTYSVVKDLREMCIFSQHSIIKDAPFSRLDMVSCRNLLIYLDAELQSKVIPLFHFALKSNGFLFLGNSENVSRHTNLFAPIEPRFRIFQRQETGSRVLPEFPFTAVDRRLVDVTLAVPRYRSSDGALTRQAERLVERYAPAFVVTDETFSVLHFSGRTGRFIEPIAGTASLNLLNLVHPDLRLDLRAALSKAAEQNRTVHIANLRIGMNGHHLMVDLVVEPLQERPDSARSFVVLFKDGATAPASELQPVPVSSPADAEHLQRLDAELRLTRERLQATIEELESTNEELKSSNEEYQSLNEELQSANEELETSKEELQSVNEELTTVNGELAHRVQDLARANSDLKNLLESTQIATIFLDNELRVMNYTPAIVDLFHLVDADLGRPIGHIKSRIVYDDLQDDARRVMRTLGSVEREIETVSPGRCYMVRVLPYRSVTNFIAGVVVTFVDITERKRAEEALRDREERFRLIVETAKDYAIFTTDRAGRIEEWSPGAAAVFGWTAQEAVGQDLSMVYTPEDREQGVPGRELATAQTEGVVPDVRWHVRKDGARVFIEGSGRPLHNGSGTFRGLMKIGQDMTERRAAEERLRTSESQAKLLLAELQHRVRNTLTMMRSIVRRTATNSETVEQYATSLDGRLSAFARVQAAVTRDPSVGLDLEMLIEDELRVHTALDGGPVSLVRGPKVLLQPKVGETLGLAIHELTTNAVKYGALARPHGHLEVTWRVDQGEGGRYLTISWIESGLDLRKEQVRRRGFGTELIERTFAYELGGEAKLSFERSGLRCTIRLSLEGRGPMLAASA